MFDALFVFATILFFAVAILYIYVCDWFIKEKEVVSTNHNETPEKLGEHGGQGQPA